MNFRIPHTSDRILAGFIGFVLAPPSGFGFYYRCTHLDAARNQDWIQRLFFTSIFDIIGLVFLWSILSIIWALFTPPWVERFLSSDIVTCVCVISTIVVIIAGIIICIRYLAS